MDFIIQFQLNMFAFLVLISVYVIIVIKSQIPSFGNRLLKFTIYATALALVVEPLTWALDGASFFSAHFLEYSTNFLLIMIAPVICGLMLSYVDYHLFKDRKRLVKRMYYMHFLLFTFVVLIINIFYPLYFSVIESTNIYQPGNFLWVNTTIITLFYVYMVIMTFMNKKRTSKYAIKIFTIFFSLPIIGMIIQLFEVNLFFSWSSIALSILVVYIFLESSNGEVDYLTRIFTRQSYEKYVKQQMEAGNEFKVIYFDLDKFKLINDTEGHLRGDKILIEFSTILNSVFHPNKMIARLGGDEFMVLDKFDMNIEDTIVKLSKLIKSSKDPVMKKQKFSYGYSTYKEGMTIDDLYNEADKFMYKNKTRD